MSIESDLAKLAGEMSRHAGWTYEPFDGLWRAWCECGWRPERSWAYEYLARNDHRSHLIARLEAEMEGRRR